MLFFTKSPWVTNILPDFLNLSVVIIFILLLLTSLPPTLRVWQLQSLKWKGLLELVLEDARACFLHWKVTREETGLAVAQPLRIQSELESRVADPVTTPGSLLRSSRPSLLALERLV